MILRAYRLRYLPQIQILLFIILGCCAEQTLAQTNRATFEMEAPVLKIKNSYYNQLHFIDSRTDTVSMGMVQLGAFNKRAKVNTTVPIKKQITSQFNKLIDPSAKTGIIVFQLRQLSFAEQTMTTKETGYCYLRAKLYRLNNTKYEELGNLDTLLTFGALDVTKRLFREGSQMITEFISSNLTRYPANVVPITYYDVTHVDSLEKSKLDLYTLSTYKNGLYQNFNSFKNQIPDYTHITCELKHNSINITKIENEQGQKIKLKSAYAVVYEGKPYIFTDNGSYPLRKEGDDLCFTGLSRVGQNTAALITTSALFGLAGVLFLNDFSSNGYFDIRLDHLNGSFIPYRQIDKEELKQKIKAGEIYKHSDSDRDL